MMYQFKTILCAKDIDDLKRQCHELGLLYIKDVEEVKDKITK